MPDDRLFHKRLGHSEKVSQLTDFEALVWHQYILSADDFGVMRFSAVTLQADSDRMAGRAVKVVTRALENVRNVGLVDTFDHQGRTYCYQRDWQNYQRVKYPRKTLNPSVPERQLVDCTLATQQLFNDHPGGWGKKGRQPFPERSVNEVENVSETFPKREVERSREFDSKPLAVSHKPLAISREPAATPPKPARLSYAGKVLQVPKFLDDEFTARLNGQFFDLTGFYERLDSQLVTSGDAWDLSWIRRQFDELSPKPKMSAMSKRTRALMESDEIFLRGGES